MRANLAALSFSIFIGAAVCSAQTAPEGPAPAASGAPQPDYTNVYCAGFVSDPKVPEDTQIISGEQSNYKIIFGRGDNVYINRGEDKGVKVGDRYTIVRPESDPANEWFRGQEKVTKAAGTLYRDGGQVRVVNVQPKVSIAEITFSCGGYMQRGDLARPFEERPVPPYKGGAAFDHFAPVSGKPVGTIFSSHDYWQLLGAGLVAYVNVGAGKGAKVGDYMRIFRYQGPGVEYTSVTKDDHYKIYGFGSAPARYESKNLPREILGEGIVLNVSRNSATVLITYTTVPVYTGDNVEIE
jgi:hypothetical protein